MIRRDSMLVLWAALLIGLSGDAAWAAAPRVAIVVGEHAPAIERLAAVELADDLHRVFQIERLVVNRPPADRTETIWIGSPQTNPAISQALPNWPKLSEQGHFLKSVKQGERWSLVLGGGSPVATYWAVSEFARHFGIRSMAYGDLDPVVTPPWKLDGFDILLEPNNPVRVWRALGESPLGSQSWGIDEHRKMIRQLARLKFNQIVIAVEPWQPFVRLDIDGVKKQSGMLWHGWKFPVDGDTAGRAAFRGDKTFDNPDFAGREGYEQRVRAGIELVRQLIDVSQKHGFQVGLEFAPLALPPEFAAKLNEGSFDAADIQPDDRFVKLASAHIAQYLNTYPTVDALHLVAATPSASPLDQVVDRNLAAEAEWNRFLQLAIESLPKESRGAKARSGKSVEFRVVRRGESNPISELLPNVNPPDATAPAIRMPASRVGVLPPFCTESGLKLEDEQAIDAEVKTTGAGIRLVEALGSENIGDLDFALHLESRRAFGPSPGPSRGRVLRELLTPICGEGVAERTWIALQTPVPPELSDLGLGVPGPTMILSHYESGDEVPKAWEKLRDHYLNSMNEMYRANTRAREGGRSYTLYLARRFEFGFEYMNCVEFVRKAGIAKRQKDADAQLANLEKAVESLYGGLNAMAAIARSNSDRGIIAVVNEFGYRPLRAELDRVGNP